MLCKRRGTELFLEQSGLPDVAMATQPKTEPLHIVRSQKEAACHQGDHDESLKRHGSPTALLYSQKHPHELEQPSAKKFA